MCAAGLCVQFGGDVCDKAPGSLQITQQLVSAKKRYPDRVFLIVGNRDMNKLRLLFELTDEAMVRMPACAREKSRLPSD